jgi:hypothetical protein
MDIARRIMVVVSFTVLTRSRSFGRGCRNAGLGENEMRVNYLWIAKQDNATLRYRCYTCGPVMSFAVSLKSCVQVLPRSVFQVLSSKVAICNVVAADYAKASQLA